MADCGTAEADLRAVAHTWHQYGDQVRRLVLPIPRYHESPNQPTGRASPIELARAEGAQLT